MPAHWVRGSRMPSEITPTTSRSTPAPGAGTALRWVPAQRAVALSAPGSSVVPRLARATPPMCLAYMSKAAVSLQMLGHWVAASLTRSRTSQAPGPMTSCETQQTRREPLQPALATGRGLQERQAAAMASHSTPRVWCAPPAKHAAETSRMFLAFMCKATMSLQMRGPGGAGSLMPFRTSQVTLARNSTFRRARVVHSPLRHRVSALIRPAIAGTSTSSRSMHQGWHEHRRKLVPPILPIHPVCTFRCEDEAHRPCVSVLFPHFQMCQ